MVQRLTEWHRFMDAEIGVRNLADSFRYNALPRVAKAIGFDIESYRARDSFKGVESLEDLPDWEQLRWMVSDVHKFYRCSSDMLEQAKAQAELTYAVRWTFQKEGVSCIGSLAASNDWSRFDEEHARDKGYRLNADPYWLSPPQGSIIPVWHKGGAPNYQPKPLIAKHRFDPVKVWHRRKANIHAKPVFLELVDGKWVRRCSL